MLNWLENLILHTYDVREHEDERVISAVGKLRGQMKNKNASDDEEILDDVNLASNGKPKPNDVGDQSKTSIPSNSPGEKSSLKNQDIPSETQNTTSDESGDVNGIDNSDSKIT